jgi:hypothetical protein
MKSLPPLLPITLAGMLLLSGCPDTQVPKAPPKVPEPKAANALPQTQFAAAPFNASTPA